MDHVELPVTPEDLVPLWRPDDLALLVVPAEDHGHALRKPAARPLFVAEEQPHAPMLMEPEPPIHLAAAAPFPLHGHDHHHDQGLEPPPQAAATATLAASFDLRWAAPTMVNPLVIDLNKTGGQTWWSFSTTQDVIFLGASTVRTSNRLQTEGGHNIMVIGGDYQPGSQATGTLAFYGVTGNVWVEGVHIDNRNAYGNDGIDIAGAAGSQPNLYVQNSRIENVSGNASSRHGDIIQTQGPVGDIRIYNLTGTTSYQGLFISPQSPTHYAYLENVNLSYANVSGADQFTYLYWFLDGTNQLPYGIDLVNVYAQPRSGQSAERFTVWPASNQNSSIAAIRDAGNVVWPTLPYNGEIIVGAPSSDFAPLAQVGLNYQSPVTTNAPGALPPIALTDTYATNAGTLLSVAKAAGVLANDTDGNGQTLSVVPTTNLATARGGSVTLNADGSFTYAPPAGYNGVDSFAYSLSDGTLVDVGTVVLKVGTQSAQGNVLPIVGAAKTVSTQAGNTVALALKAPMDGNGDPLMATVGTLPTGGVVVEQDGTPLHSQEPLSLGQLAGLRFIPNANFTGNAGTFTYTVTDLHGGTATGSVGFTVTSTASNHSPTVDPAKTLAMVEDSGATLLALNPPSDIDGDTLAIAVNGLPTAAQGVVTYQGTALAAGQSLSATQLSNLAFTPAADFSGDGGAFTYTVTDGHGGSAQGAVFFSVSFVNDAPVVEAARSVGAAAGSTTALNIAAPTDADNDPLTVTVTHLPTSGAILLNGTALAQGNTIPIAQIGQLQYKAGASQSSANYFEYGVADTHGAVVTGHIDFTVLPAAQRIEAESMTLRGYQAANVTGASGGRDIRLGLFSSNGTATTTYTGPDGTYDIRIAYYDTDNGSARLQLALDGSVVDSWMLNQHLGSSSPNATTLVTRTFANVSLHTNEQIQLIGRVGGSDRAQVDYIEIVPQASPLTTAADQLAFQ